MRRLKAHNRGFTLVEILVASLILALVVAGIANIFVAGKKYILHARSRMVGAEIGKYFLDPLQMDVRQDKWSGNATCLSGDVNKCPQSPAGSGYNATYAISPQNATEPDALRRVQLNVTWTEN